MNNALQIYICPTDGEVLEDETYFKGNGQRHCLHCDQPAAPKMLEINRKEGKEQGFFYRLVNKSRWMEAAGHYAEPPKAS